MNEILGFCCWVVCFVYVGVLVGLVVVVVVVGGCFGDLVVFVWIVISKSFIGFCFGFFQGLMCFEVMCDQLLFVQLDFVFKLQIVDVVVGCFMDVMICMVIVM